MSNNYVQFSGSITHLTADEERWLRHALRDIFPELTGGDDADRIKELVAAEPWRDEDDVDLQVDFQFDFGSDKDDGSYLHVYAEESGSAWAAAQLAHAFLKQFRPTEIWSMNWSTTCDKMRVDNFGGGAVVATAKEVRTLNSYVWVEHLEKHFRRTGELPKVRKVKRPKTGRFGAMNEAEIVGEMGWNADSVSQLMSAFIAERGLTEAYVTFLAGRAKEEEDEAKTL